MCVRLHTQDMILCACEYPYVCTAFTDDIVYFMSFVVYNCRKIVVLVFESLAPVHLIKTSNMLYTYKDCSVCM